MTRLGRLVAVTFVLLGALFVAPGSVWATHCPPEHYQHPPGVPDNYPCPDPEQTQRPDPTPTPAPTASPAPTPARTATPTRRPTTGTTRTTPRPTTSTAETVEVPTADPQVTPEIIVDPIGSDEQPLPIAEPSASASSWIFGFIVGLLVGGFAGRASWGLKRRRRQQIFG